MSKDVVMSDDPQQPLHTTTAAYSFPPFHALPPFYTLQPVDSTRRRQLEMWEELILDYCRAHKLHTLVLSEAIDMELFNNVAIKRRLSHDTLIKVLDSLVDNGRAEWVDSDIDDDVKGRKGGSKSICIILWKSIAEWAGKLYEWVSENGAIGNVFTIFELVSGDGMDADLASLDERVLRRAVAVLQSNGKAQLFTGSSGSDGVKFFR